MNEALKNYLKTIKLAIEYQISFVSLLKDLQEKDKETYLRLREYLTANEGKYLIFQDLIKENAEEGFLVYKTLINFNEINEKFVKIYFNNPEDKQKILEELEEIYEVIEELRT